MGNCLAINVEIPCHQLLTVCFSQERRRTITHLKNDWERLKAARDDISRTIEESPEMRPLEIVNQWLRRVEVLEDQVKLLITDYTQESANKCFCSYCPRNCKKSYSLWKKISPLDQEVLDLHKQVPDVVVERPRTTPALQVPTEPTTGMQSMLDEVWSHVEDEQDHVRLIGLYGMGGVGKTTLLKAVNNKLCSSTQNFDLQFWIVVSKSPNLVGIQNHIGEKIGFHGGDWERKSQEEKATNIYNVLCKKKYVLLLDDIWERFDLTKIGIPLPDFQNKSKIIFTTRSKKVCGQMKARQILVQCLKEEEAWNLFKENVGEDALNAHRDIPGLAKDVMRECSGLPLALIVIGRAMTCAETIHDWEHAIQVLKRYAAAEFSTMTDEVFTLLKYSYDNLTNDTIRSCFLYCSLYAEDEEISKSDLVDKWICEGFLGRFHDLDKDRNEGYNYISTLVHVSLLEKCSDEKKVKMHDVIRDMALWIAGDSFYVKARAGLTEVPKDVKWGHVEKLSLMNNSIKELNKGPTEVTNLKTILVYRGGFRYINNDFWKFVPNLKVIDLSGNQELTSLPEEFCKLVYLQYLNLSSTNLKELPNEFRKLTKLIYLNVEFTKIYTIPEGILSSMKELSVFRCGGNYNVHSNFLGENLVKEFEGLKCLQNVVIQASSKVEIPNLTSSIHLLNCITTLTLISFSDSTSLDFIFLKEMKHLQILLIQGLEKVEKVVIGEGEELETSTTRNQNGFNTLRRLEVLGCSRLKNLSWLVFFPNIEYIKVADCDEVETLVSENEYKVDNEVESFAKLQTLQLWGLKKLESIYFTSLSFPCLNQLFVGVCKNLKRLPFNSSSCDQGRGITIQCRTELWNELQWEDEATRTTFSSCFQSLLPQNKHLEHIIKSLESIQSLVQENKHHEHILKSLESLVQENKHHEHILKSLESLVQEDKHFEYNLKSLESLLQESKHLVQENKTSLTHPQKP